MHFVLQNYLERQEKDFILVFFVQNDQCLVVNETGLFILRLLKTGNSLGSIIDAVAKTFSTTGVDQITETLNFIKTLKVNNLLSEVEITKPTENFVEPAIYPLGEIYEKGKQCETFCMPERSCKSLPSGVNGNNSKSTITTQNTLV